MRLLIGVSILVLGMLSGVCEAGYKKAKDIDLKDGSVEAMMVQFVRDAHAGNEECLKKLTSKFSSRTVVRDGALVKYLDKFKELNLAELFKIKSKEKKA